jgi:hypothetical protein
MCSLGAQSEAGCQDGVAIRFDQKDVLKIAKSKRKSSPSSFSGNAKGRSARSRRIVKR